MPAALALPVPPLVKVYRLVQGVQEFTKPTLTPVAAVKLATPVAIETVALPVTVWHQLAGEESVPHPAL